MRPGGCAERPRPKARDGSRAGAGVPAVPAIIFAIAIVLLSGIAAGSANSPPTALECPPFAAAALPLPTPQRDPHAIERFHLINDAVRAGPHAILFFGDSLTEKWDPAIWARDFAPRGALNAGVNGDRTEHLLWRLQHGNLEGQHPQAVVLLIGTNDIGRDRPPAVVADGIRAILEALGARLPSARILLLGVLPRGEWAWSPRRRQVSEVNRLIREVRRRRAYFVRRSRRRAARSGRAPDPPDFARWGASERARLCPAGGASRWRNRPAPDRRPTGRFAWRRDDNKKICAPGARCEHLTARNG